MPFRYVEIESRPIPEARDKSTCRQPFCISRCSRRLANSCLRKRFTPGSGDPPVNKVGFALFSAFIFPLDFCFMSGYIELTPTHAYSGLFIGTRPLSLSWWWMLKIPRTSQFSKLFGYISVNSSLRWRMLHDPCPSATIVIVAIIHRAPPHLMSQKRKR